MWPFTDEERKPEYSYADDAVAELSAFRKAGERFNYLGATIMVSVVHKEYIGCGVWRGVMETNYRDGEGRIRSLYFYRSDLPAMKSENP